ncbi:unnamed protein product [Amoebophrya sp. A120]|nr:unnamed protein product [Amoebophrya sp. A120]|eukprot:GSA120T00010980001.1
MRRVLVASGATGAVVALKSRAEAGNSGIKKVISLLTDMKTKVEQEITDGDKEAEEFENWCIKTTTEGEADVKYGGEKVEELKATVENEAAKASGFANEVATLTPEIATLQGEQTKAADERKEAHATFQKEEAELVEADTMLQKAYSVLKRSLSFTQTDGIASSKAVREAQNAVTALSTIIESVAMDAESQQKIKAFLEESNELRLGQPQAVSSSYQSKSGGILDAIQGMQEKNAEVLAGIREKDLKARHEFELLMQDLKNQETSKTEQMEAAKENAAKAEAAGKTAGGDLASAEEVLKSDTEELANTKAECDSKAKSWAARKEEATQESGALGQAIEILSGKFGGESFLQISDEVGSEETQKRAKVSLMLRRLGRTYNQFALIQAANSAQADPFVKVRGMIKEMITKLEDEAAKEASKEAKCKADKEKGTKDLKLRKGESKKLQSRVDAAEAKFAQLGTEISDLEAQLAELAADVKERTAIRGKEKKENDAVIKDSAESVEAINGAITALSEFYGKSTSFLQQPQTDAANTIISILETAQEDFEKLKQETEAAESDAVEKYEKFMQESQVAKATKEAEVKGKTQEKAGVKESIGMMSEDLTEANKALQAATDFLKGVMEACANKAMSYEERQKRREAEIAGLKDALEILSSDEESFLQVRATPSKPAEKKPLLARKQKKDDCDCILDSKSNKMVSKKTGDDCDCILDSKQPSKTVAMVVQKEKAQKKKDDCDCILDSKSNKMVSKKTGDDCDCILDSAKKGF